MKLTFGIERETHRISADGELSVLPQPSGLKPPEFTKDFAETQLEIVTKPTASIENVLTELDRLTAAAEKAVRPELLWPFSMPPRLSSRETPIARLGNGREARAGELYRRGLLTRYGAGRQLICGVHVNVSIADPRTESELRFLPHETRGRPSDAPYLRLARNLYEDLPHLVLLTGASPLPGGLRIEGHRTVVSHRNSPYGYAGGEFRPYLDLTSLEAYVSGVRRGLATESERFKAFGLVRDGVPFQLNSRVFQRESEFYAPVRLKRSPAGGAGGLRALESRGIEYLELRFPDVDPFDARGISATTLTLLALFVKDGLMRPSGAGGTRELVRRLEAAERAALMPLAAPRGRTARAAILCAARARLEALRPLARRLDDEEGAKDPSYAGALEEMIDRTMDPGRLPAARLLEALESSGRDWTSFGAGIAAARAPAQSESGKRARIGVLEPAGAMERRPA
jgi:glutamate--cysteine ligase